MIAVQEMCGRISVVTGQGLASVIKEHYPRWLLYSSVVLLIGANVINIYADLNVMAASAQMLLGLSQVFWLTVITVGICLSVVFIPYRLYVNVLKWLCLSMGAYVVVVFLPGMKNDWGAIGTHFVVPYWSNKPEFILTVVGFLGTTISPYLFFWQAGEQVEDEISEGSADRFGHRTKPWIDPRFGDCTLTPLSEWSSRKRLLFSSLCVQQGHFTRRGRQISILLKTRQRRCSLSESSPTCSLPPPSLALDC